MIALMGFAVWLFLVLKPKEALMQEIDTKTVTFTLSKSDAFGHPWAGHVIKVTLVDTAGNEFSMAEVVNIYVGNWLMRYWILFTVGGILLVGAGVFIFLRARKKKED